jgi:hypothetical protein
MEFAHREGLLPAIVLMVLPFVILWGLLKVLPPWSNVGPTPGAVESSPCREPEHAR